MQKPEEETMKMVMYGLSIMRYMLTRNSKTSITFQFSNGNIRKGTTMPMIGPSFGSKIKKGGTKSEK